MDRIWKKTRKLLCGILAVCLLLALLPAKALALDVDYELYYTENGGFLRVNRYTGVLQDGQNLSGDLVIPSEVSGVKVTAIADGAFDSSRELTSVTVPSTVVVIGAQAFNYCDSLESVKINEGTTTLGKNAFRYCYSLKNVSLPSTLTAIESNTFESCLALTAITVPQGVTRIGDRAFVDCQRLQTVSLPTGLRTLGDYCFSECPELREINLPNGLEAIPIACFSGCVSLNTLILPGSVTAINGLAFRRCSGLSRLSLPDSIKSIQASAFENCGDVTFYVNAGSYAQAFAAANKISFVLGLLDSGVSEPLPSAELPFTDVQEHWAKTAIAWAYEKGYFAGTSATTFSPNANVNRGMFASVLYRMEGRPNTGTSSFTDVDSSAYYARAVAWAESAEVVSGVGGGCFDPGGNITREQLAAMLYRYAQYKGIDTSARGDLGLYKDTDQIGNYAGTAVAWCVGVGIISGVTTTEISPKGNATRAQCAVMLQKFSQL